MSFDFKTEYVNAILILGKSYGAGLATIGLAGAGVGVGVVFGSLVFALSHKARLFKFAMLGFALTEAVGLFFCILFFLLHLNYLILLAKISLNLKKFLAYGVYSPFLLGSALPIFTFVINPELLAELETMSGEPTAEFLARVLSEVERIRDAIDNYQNVNHVNNVNIFNNNEREE